MIDLRRQAEDSWATEVIIIQCQQDDFTEVSSAHEK